MINFGRHGSASVFALAILLTMLPVRAQPIAASPLEARKNDAAGVQVVVTPKSLDASATSWDFEVVLDTHTKPLSDDMVRAGELIADGRSYAPIGWEGDQPGGHHRKGFLRFPRPVETPKIVEVRVNGIGGVAIRSFRWKFR